VRDRILLQTLEYYQFPLTSEDFNVHFYTHVCLYVVSNSFRRIFHKKGLKWPAAEAGTLVDFLWTGFYIAFEDVLFVISQRRS
jgi:hypothetical protein